MQFDKQPLDLRPKRFIRKDGGESVQYFLPKTEYLRSSNYWLKRLHVNDVITLTGINPSIRVDNGCLEICQGGTLANTNPDAVYYPRASHNLSWVIIDSPNGYVTIDALRWLRTQEIGVMVVTNGVPTIFHDVEKPIVSLRRRQYVCNPLVVGRWILRGKLATYTRVFNNIPEWETVHDLIHGTTLDNVTNLMDLRLLEGRIAKKYWQYQAFTLKTYKKFPTWWLEFKNRSSDVGVNNKHATHPINAILNYAYAVVTGMIKRKCIMTGLDVSIGSLHADNDRRDSLCYDLLELVRGDVDVVLLTWAKSVIWRRTDFRTSELGVVSLDDSLRRVVIEKISHLQKEVDKVVKDYVLFLLRVYPVKG